jgi:hypothetical protein
MGVATLASAPRSEAAEAVRAEVRGWDDTCPAAGNSGPLTQLA